MRIVLRTVLNTAMFGYLRYILRFEFAKTIVVFQISTLKFTNSQSFMQKEKALNLGLTFGLQFWKTIAIFEIKNPQIFQNAKFHSKLKKTVGLRPKMPYLSILRQKLKKNYCHVWNQHPQFCQKVKFSSKI